ncbi:hypothetical protein HB_00025 [Paenibacillus phage HB10c2]|uniref:Uncharacterized protein n=1 Tax=Paenibacillus phage HB10c2 TaxID=1589749 RepID=A0A0B5A030_9CAUD|nr:hypothetical protein AVV26_gp25 [Paenibacillus phage HB10c2]AJD83037.1 hypothetical protein HB_00025 [Paenibacillus phage HB10c2]
MMAPFWELLFCTLLKLRAPRKLILCALFVLLIKFGCKIAVFWVRWLQRAFVKVFFIFSKFKVISLNIPP